MLNIYDGFLDKLTKVLKIMLAVIFISCLIIGVAQVLSRYILPFNLSWTHEMTAYGFVWMSMIGAAIAGGEKGHIAMEFVKARLKGKAKKLTESIIYTSSIVVFFILTYYGIVLTLRNAVQLSPTMQISMAIPYAAVPVGSLCLALYTIRHFLSTFIVTKSAGSEVNMHG